MTISGSVKKYNTFVEPLGLQSITGQTINGQIQRATEIVLLDSFLPAKGRAERRQIVRNFIN